MTHVVHFSGGDVLVLNNLRVVPSTCCELTKKGSDVIFLVDIFLIFYHSIRCTFVSLGYFREFPLPVLRNSTKFYSCRKGFTYISINYAKDAPKTKTKRKRKQKNSSSPITLLYDLIINDLTDAFVFQW